MDDTKRSDIEALISGNVEAMAFPPTEWEAEALADVLSLPRVTVLRPPREQLLELGMRPYDCHANCARQEAEDPDGLSRHVCGWMIYSSCLILHSVAQIEGRWFCLTPQLIDVPATFEFIPDPLLTWVTADDGLGQPQRRGISVPSVLRKFPQYHLRMREKFRELVASGMSAIEARQVIEASADIDPAVMQPL